MTDVASQVHELKALSKSAIPRALEKADRYRLLNEPVEAESICLDILRADPDSQEALVTLLLAITDQFHSGYKMGEVTPTEVLSRLRDPYQKAYYAGIVAERRGKAILEEGASGTLAHPLLMHAMEYYEDAIGLSPQGNDDAILRWNTCARMLNSPGVRPPEIDVSEIFLE